MCRECWERFHRHRLQRKPLVRYPGMHHGTCVMHVPWCISGWQNCVGGENVPGIPCAYATHNFTYLTRGPCHYQSQCRCLSENYQMNVNEILIKMQSKHITRICVWMCQFQNINPIRGLNIPLNTWRNNNVVITSKRRHFDVITSKWRRCDVITTSLSRDVSAGMPHIVWGLWCENIYFLFCFA